MDKILVMVRTSTDAQSIADQHKEMEEFCLSEGWTKESIVWVEEQGASAAKVDDTYREMINKVKDYVNADPEIKCFAVWHLNRLARTEEIWVEVKSFFVSKRVQIICKNPYLKLLTPSGDVDQGIELAMGLLAILSKQDQAERKAKFKRAKSAMAKKGQYIGGNTKKYGYRVDDEKFFVEDPDESKVVRMVFNMYSTGNYSVYTLSQELKERGIEISDNHISRILRCRAYLGEEVGGYGMHYPQIVSKEVFEECERIRSGNKLNMKRGERLLLGAKLVKCFNCGAVCTSNSKHYVCCRKAHHGECTNSFHLRQEVAHSLLWRVAEMMHIQYLMGLNKEEKEKMEAELEVVKDKLYHMEYVLEKDQEKKDKIVDAWLDGYINEEKRDLRLSKVEDDIRAHQDTLASLRGKLDAITSILESSGEMLEDSLEVLDGIETEKERYDIVHQHILSLVFQPVSFGDRDPRCKKENGVEITVNTKVGGKYRFMYVPKYYKGSNLYIWNGRKWKADHF